MTHLILPRPTVETIEVPYEEMRRIAAAADQLDAWGLQLVCPNCSRYYGQGHDGVIANNAPGADVLEIRCGCTIRRCTVRRN